MEPGNLDLAMTLLRRFQVARKECRNYQPTHPVSVEASSQLMSMLATWFESHKEFTVEGDGRRLSVGGVVLSELGNVGAQMAAMFQQYGLGSITFKKGVAKEQIMILIKVLEKKSEEDMVGWINKALLTGGGGILVRGPGDSQPEPEPEKAHAHIGGFYDASITVVRNVLESVSAGNEVDVMQLRKLSRQMVSAILDEPKKLFLVTTSHPDFREDLFDHSLDVAIVATSLAATLRRDRAWLEEIMFCGIVHDVGKARIPKEILYKPGKLDAAEWEIMMTHAELGGQILYGVKGVGDLAPQVAFEHQAKFNLSGYPKLKFKKGLHPVTQFVIIADTYSALTAVRAYKKPFSPGRSLAIMEEMSGSAFQPRLFNQFVTMANFFSRGTRARLATGEEVTVLKAVPEAAMRPLVLVDASLPDSEVREGDVLDLTEIDPYSGRYKWNLADTLDDPDNVY